MKALIIKDSLEEYLSVSKYINWNDNRILSKADEFKQKYADELSLVKVIYEFVRDEIKHSWDVQDKRVTKSAAEVLEQGAGGVSFYQVMPTYHNHSGKKAYIMNMYTAPEYRRQGIALHTLDLLVKDAKKQGVSQIALEATDMGRPLYEKYGFVKMEGEMELMNCRRCLHRLHIL